LIEDQKSTRAGSDAGIGGRLDMTNDNNNQPKIAHVIPWDSGKWGVAIDLPNGQHTAYAVAGSRIFAGGECLIIGGGNAPAFGPWAGMDLASYSDRQ
jgi:hypothetical protein